MNTDRLIPMDDIELQFNQHLKLSNNERIIFSGRFGTGKTTFLNHFFDNQMEYNVIKLYPVHYSISPNEDIYEFVKFDILCQLLSKGVGCNALEWKNKELIPEYIAKNLYPILGKFIKFIPKIGSLTDGLVQVLNAVKNDYKKFKEEKKDNELNQIMSFLYGKISIVGTPYEQDHISNIINEILGRLKKDTDNLKTVLLIDDFDRIDPEHTFRLLNIFASQCDPQSLRGMKFNFDHVIIVCDVNNIRYFFHHKYGMNTDFNGYIDKFYCKEIFNFDIKWKFIDKLKDFLSPLQSNSLIKPIAWEATKNVIEELINRGEINLRNAHRFNSISIKMESYIAADIIMNKTDPAVTMFNILSAVLSGEAELERIINKYNSINLMYSTSSNLFYTAGILFHIIDHKNTKFRIGQGTSIANRIGNFCYSCKSFGDFREGYILRIMKIEEASTATAYSSDFFPFWHLMKTAYDSRKQYLISGEKVHN